MERVKVEPEALSSMLYTMEGVDLIKIEITKLACVKTRIPLGM